MKVNQIVKFLKIVPLIKFRFHTCSHISAYKIGCSSSNVSKFYAFSTANQIKEERNSPVCSHSIHVSDINSQLFNHCLLLEFNESLPFTLHVLTANYCDRITKA
jgi:hypothetical protein